MKAADMKSVLLHVFEDKELDDRLSVALDVCRAHDAHLTCACIRSRHIYYFRSTC